MELTKRQQSVVRRLAALRADLVVTPEASDEAREIGKRLDVAHDVVRALLPEKTFYAMVDLALVYRDEVLTSRGYVRDQYHGGWRKQTEIDHAA